MDQHTTVRDALEALAKLTATWGFIAWGWLTLQHVATALAAIYSALQIVKLLREEFARRRA